MFKQSCVPYGYLGLLCLTPITYNIKNINRNKVNYL